MPDIDVIIKSVLDDTGFQAGIKNMTASLNGAKQEHKSFTDMASAGWLVVTAAVIGFVASLKNFIDTQIAAIQSQQNLNESLKITGQYSAEAVTQINNWVAGLSEATGVQSDVIRNLDAMAIKQGLNTDEAEKATQTTLGLAKAMGIDQTSAMKMVLQAHEGNFNMLTRYIPSLRTETDATQKMADVNKIAQEGLNQIAAGMTGYMGATAEAGVETTKFKEFIGDLLMKILTPFVLIFDKVVKGFLNLPGPVKTAAVALGILIAMIGVGMAVLPGLTTMVAALGVSINAALLPIAAISAGILALSVGAYELINHWGEVKIFFIKIWGDIKVIFDDAIAGILKGIEFLEAPLIKLIDLIITGINKIKGTHISTLTEILQATEKHFKDLADAQKTANEKEIADEKDKQAKILAEKQKGVKAGLTLSKQETDEQALSDQDLAKIDKLCSESEIAQKNKEIKAIQEKIKTLQDYQKLVVKGSDEENKIATALANYEIKLDQAVYDEQKKDIEKGLSEFTSISGQIQSAKDASFQNDLDQADQDNAAQKAAYQNTCDSETAMLNEKLAKGLISQDDYNNQLAAIQQKNADDSAKLDKKTAHDKGVIANKQAESDKDAATTSAFINAALSIIRCFSDLGPIAGAVAAVGIGIATAMQVSAIENKPIPPVPSYAAGGLITDVAMAEMAPSGEDGFVAARMGEAILNQQAVAYLGKDMVNSLNMGMAMPRSSGGTINNINRSTTDNSQTQNSHTFNFPNMRSTDVMDIARKTGARLFRR